MKEKPRIPNNAVILRNSKNKNKKMNENLQNSKCLRI